MIFQLIFDTFHAVVGLQKKNCANNLHRNQSKCAAAVLLLLGSLARYCYAAQLVAPFCCMPQLQAATALAPAAAVVVVAVFNQEFTQSPHRSDVVAVVVACNQPNECTMQIFNQNFLFAFSARFFLFSSFFCRYFLALVSLDCCFFFVCCICFH